MFAVFLFVTIAVWLLLGFLAFVIICYSSCKEDEISFWKEFSEAMKEETNAMFLITLAGLFSFLIVVINELFEKLNESTLSVWTGNRQLE